MNKNLLFILFFSLLINSSCKKGSGITNEVLQQYFETNLLNRNFIVTLAQKDGSDITADYKGYVFVLMKGNDYYNGPMTATLNGVIYNGTWSSNDDYSKLIIMLPGAAPEFSFLNRAWRFTSKSLPSLDLAPWGSTEAVVLHMLRQ